MIRPIFAIFEQNRLFYVPFSAKPFFRKQETPILGHDSAHFAPLRGHPPKMAKVIFRKQETPILGHAFSPHPFYPLRGHPPKMAKAFF